jgi:hypothetical protein
MREAIGRRKLEDEYNRFLREMRGEAFVEIKDASAAAAPEAPAAPAAEPAVDQNAVEQPAVEQPAPQAPADGG